MMINCTIHNMAINDVGDADADGSTPMNANGRSVGRC